MVLTKSISAGLHGAHRDGVGHLEMTGQAFVDQDLGPLEVHGKHALAGLVQVLDGARVVGQLGVLRLWSSYKTKRGLSISNVDVLNAS